jgi:microsomal dipeptidase-like Zn-dependent dipeptidase
MKTFWLTLVMLISSAPLASGGDVRRDVSAQRHPLPRANENVSRGFADYHAHMFSNEAFGGLLFWGKAFVPKPEPDATADALRQCEHARWTHPITSAAVNSLEPDHKASGYPDFQMWPTFSSMVHQQMYVDSLYRAYQYGLRLVVLTATNSEVLCKLAAHPLSCADDDAVQRQVNAIHEMNNYIGTNEGGWLEIAETPADAQRIITSNRLAVVIGVEVDKLFGCGLGRGHICSQDEVLRKLDEYYRAGVRQFTPIHLADSAFGGNALYDDRLVANSYYLTGDYQQTEDCSVKQVTWRPRGAQAVGFSAMVLAFVNGFGWYSPDYGDPGGLGQCNSRGLSDLGRFLIAEMVKRGVLIDLQHMSARSTADTLAIARDANYPVMLSHAWFRDLKLSREELTSRTTDEVKNWTEQRSEMHTSRKVLEIVRDLGGVVGVLTNQGFVEDGPQGSPPNDCDTSSKSFAQAYLYAVRAMGGKGGVGLGTDFNGLAGQPGPRFDRQGCRASVQQQKRQNARLVYDGQILIDGVPLTSSVIGNRQFDFNDEGLAQYGLLPDLIADLQQTGMPSDALDTLFGSAAAYVKMWTAAEARAKNLQVNR